MIYIKDIFINININIYIYINNNIEYIIKDNVI